MTFDTTLQLPVRGRSAHGSPRPLSRTGIAEMDHE